MNRIFNAGQKPDKVFSDRNGANKYKRFYQLRVGRIIPGGIDHDRYRFKVEWMTGQGSPEWIPMSFPYVGPGSCIAAMPEEGALVICAYLTDDDANPRPLPLAYLPRAMQAGLEGAFVKNQPDALPNEQQPYTFYRFRPLQDGDLNIASVLGGEVFVNKDVEIKDGMRDTLLLRAADQSIIATSINNFMFANGVAINAGQIIRNKTPIFDANGVRIPDQLAREISLPGGRTNIHLVPFGAQVNETTQFYSEYRIDVDDLVTGGLEANDINSQTSLSNRDPIVSLTMGNYVGSSDDNRYGKILRPVLFNTPLDTEGQFDLVECVQNKGLDEVSSLGLAYAIHLLKKDSLFAFDKEGHCFLNLSASTTANPLGAGRSMSVLGLGNLKEVWGKTADTANSWDLSTSGGIKWNIGQHNDQANNRSIDITTSSSVKLVVTGSEVDANDPDFNVSADVAETTTTYSRQEVITGSQKVSIGGTEKTTVAGNSILKVNGMRREQVGGSASYEYQTDKSENIMGVYTQVVIKEMQGRFGKRKETVYLGQELSIMTGDMKESIVTFGNKKTTLTLGNIEETIVAGNKKIQIGAGNYELTVGAGKVSILAAAGTVNITGGLGVTIKGVKADIQALKVGIGHPVRGGVVTGLPGAPSHFDFLTGLPLRASMTVQAGI